MKVIATFLSYLYLQYEENGDSDLNCWNWNRIPKGSDRGFIRTGNKIESASRVAYKEFKGSVPKDKMVLHKCNNSICVNPFHLYIGTAQDNADDRKNRNKFLKEIRLIEKHFGRKKSYTLGKSFSKIIKHKKHKSK